MLKPRGGAHGAHPVLFFPCALPRLAAHEGRFRRALFESHSGAPGVRLARSSCAAPLACSWSREPRRGGKHGSPFLWLLYFGEAKESN